MQQSCFITVIPIDRVVYTVFLTLDSAALLGVGSQVGFDSPSFTATTGTVGIFPMVG